MLALVVGLLPGSPATADDHVQAATSSPHQSADLPPMRVERAVVLSAPRWVLPVSDYTLTGRFGNAGGLWSSAHTGLDFAAPSGTSVVSVAAGVVVEAGDAGAFGNRAVVRLGDGTEVWYCHLDSFDARVGETVDAGGRLGYVGSTGNSTGAHLHLEIRPGGASADPVDPDAHLAQRGVRV